MGRRMYLIFIIFGFYENKNKINRELLVFFSLKLNGFPNVLYLLEYSTNLNVLIVNNCSKFFKSNFAWAH